MSLEIYGKFYLALLRSLQKKVSRDAVRQKYENLRAVRQQVSNGIMGGLDSFTIIGASGIGKSSAISRALDLITVNGIIRIENPYTQIIPCIVVQCPFDSSVKGLLLEILRKVDEQLGSKYHQNALRVRCTTDMLIGSVSQVALNHIPLCTFLLPSYAEIADCQCGPFWERRKKPKADGTAFGFLYLWAKQFKTIV